MSERVEGRVFTPVGERSRTKQSFSAESDINAIMRKYLSTGVVPEVRPGEGRFGDFTSGADYFEAMVRVRQAEAIFAALPVQVRIACDHDPRKLLDLVYSADPADRKKAEDLGLVERAKDLPPEVPAAGEVPPAGGTGAAEGAVSGG